MKKQGTTYMNLRILHRNQSGMGAIIITTILITVIGLITLGIGDVSNTNAHQSLNDQLSVQANYAAETGVNDAIYALKNGLVPLPTASEDTQCSSSSPSTSFIGSLESQNISPVLSTSPYVAYTCLIVNPSPGNLQEAATMTQSNVFRVDPSTPTGSLTFTWPISGLPSQIENCTALNPDQLFPPLSNWTCPFPVLRLDIYSYNSADPDESTQALENNTDSFYLYPNYNGSGVANVAFGTSTTATVVPAVCSAVSSTCTATLDISKIDGVTGQKFSDGYVRLSSLYDDVTGDVTVSAGPSNSFENGQLEIDSTGIDQSELQRIAVRVPFTNVAGVAPSYAIDAAEQLCKRYTIQPAGTTGSADPDITSGGTPTSSPLCADADKPVIYLYPDHAENVNVKLDYPTGFSASIPTYNTSTGWNVLAQPDGTLTNLSNGVDYPYLYWEGNPKEYNFDLSSGFVIKGSDTAAFLSKELAIIGLNKSESSAFLQYWVPRMQHNKYTLIHFAGSDYTSVAKLTISPKPDSLLRVFMVEEPLAKPVNVTPQTFTTFKRTGFTAVEWGGTVL
jgi:hypothetical protein